MIITPRFFVLPIIALIVIASLPRPATESPPQQLAMAQSAPVR